MIVLCGNLTIPYCGRFFHCFYLEERKNCATALAGHRAAILFNKMQRVFDNLLRNAVSYCNADTSIKIIAEQIEDHVLIKVMNEGNTIPQERLERIFEQFYRLDVSRSSTTGGAGLGLAIAKEIVELHHGQITAHSADGFTCFEVSLPLVRKS